MKRFLTAMLSIVFLLSGCGLVSEEPEVLQINNKAYKTGFYGTLFPNEYSLTEYSLESNGLKLVRIAHDAFELYHADAGHGKAFEGLLKRYFG